MSNTGTSTSGVYKTMIFSNSQSRVCGKWHLKINVGAREITLCKVLATCHASMRTWIWSSEPNPKPSVVASAVMPALVRQRWFLPSLADLVSFRPARDLIWPRNKHWAREIARWIKALVSGLMAWVLARVRVKMEGEPTPASCSLTSAHSSLKAK